MGLVLKIIGGIALVLVSVIIGFFAYVSSFIPDNDFDYKNATYTERADYLNQFGDLFSLLVKSQNPPGLTVEVAGVNPNERKVYVDFRIDQFDVDPYPDMIEEFRTTIANNFAREACRKADGRNAFFKNDIILHLNFHDVNSKFSQLQFSKESCPQLS